MTGPFTTVTTRQWERLQDVLVAAEALLRWSEELPYETRDDFAELRRAVEKAKKVGV